MNNVFKDTKPQIKTFFYYGPNTVSNLTFEFNDNEILQPSNTVIQNFVNDQAQLNLPSTSKENDIVYIIYQKTGIANKACLKENNTPSKIINSIFTPGSPVQLNFNEWYNVSEYFSVNAIPDSINPLNLNFRSTAQSKPITFEYMPSNNEAYIAWDQDNIIFDKSIQPRPLKDVKTTQFCFSIKNNITNNKITAIPKIYTMLRGSSENTIDVNNIPIIIFVIWKLVYQQKNKKYNIDLNFPKIIQTQQLPKNWDNLLAKIKFQS